MKIIFTVIAAMLIATSSFASVIYTDIDPDGSVDINNATSSQGIDFDIDNDGTDDYNFSWAVFGSNWEVHLNILSAAVPPNTSYEVLVHDASSDMVKYLDAGTTIDAGTAFWNNYANYYEPLVSTDYDGNVMGLGEKYLALRFGVPGNWKYAWLRIIFDNNQILTVYDYAIEDTPETPIIAGNTGSPAILVQSIAVTGDGGATTIATMGGTLQMNAAVLPVDATNQNVTWSVDNVAIATIDANGLLTAVSNGIVTVIATANDASGVTGSLDVTITGQNSGLSQNDLSHLLTLYPNPAVHSLKILNNTEFNIETVRIYSMNGSEVMTIIGMNEFIDVSNLEAGNYHITFELSNGEMTAQKFVKQ